MTSKEFGKLSRQQLREFYVAYHQFKDEQEELRREASRKKDKLKVLIAKTGSWGKYYEFTYIQIIAMFLVASKLDAAVITASKKEDPQQEILELTDDEWEPEGLTDEDAATLLGLFLAHIGNINGVAMFSLPVSTLVERVTNGNDESLFQAVLIDRSVVQAEPIARRICQAQLAGDESFMNALAKAITRTKPTRPKQELDDVRFILEMLEESCGLNTLTHNQLCDLFIDDLEVYPDNGKDPMSSLKKLIQKRNRESRN